MNLHPAITAAGRVLATLIMLLDVGIVASSSRFAEELQGRRDELAAKLDVEMVDGELDQLLVLTCPHCGKAID